MEFERLSNLLQELREDHVSGSHDFMVQMACSSCQGKLHSQSTGSALSGVSSLQAPSYHENLLELPLAMERSLAAVVTQCLSLASFCVAVCMQEWIKLHLALSRTEIMEPWVDCTFGIPHVLQINVDQGNTSELQTIHFFSDRNQVEQVMTTICFLIVSFGFFAFLLDFIDIPQLGKHRYLTAAVLHVLTGIMISILLMLCIQWLLKMDQKLTSSRLKAQDVIAYPGESFYVTLAFFAVVILTVLLSCSAVKLSKGERSQDREAPQFTTIVARDTNPIAGDQHLHPPRASMQAGALFSNGLRF